MATRLDQYFTVGLFSILSALMDLPLADILRAVPLDTEAVNALADHSGRMGNTLRNVLDYERGRMEASDNDVSATYQDAYIGALQWCRNSQRAMHA